MKSRIRQAIQIAVWTYVVWMSLGTAAAEYEIGWYTFDGGGGSSEGDAFTLSGSTGQPDAGVLSGEYYTVTGGFWPLPGGSGVEPPDPEPGGPSCAPGDKFCHNNGGPGEGNPCTTDGDCLSPGKCWDDCWGAWYGADCIVDDPQGDTGTCYVPKNRYLSIDPTTNPGPVGYQVEVVEASAKECIPSPTRCETDADCAPDGGTCEPFYGPGFVGNTWWVEAPQCYDYPAGTVVVPTPATCQGGNRFGWVSTFAMKCVGGPKDGQRCKIHAQCPSGACVPYTPPLRVWTESPIHITDCGIVPIVTYHIRASADEGGSFSETALEINTIHEPSVPHYWGDVTAGPEVITPASGNWLPPERVMNFADISACILAFRGVTGGTGHPPPVWCDVEANQVVNLADIQFLVMAFSGIKYTAIGPFPDIGGDPAECPSVGRSGDGPNRACSVAPGGDTPLAVGAVSTTRTHSIFDPADGRGVGLPEPGISLVPGKTIASPGESVAVDVFVTDALNIGVYEVAVEVSGGAAGRLMVEDLFVDAESNDYVFTGVESLQAVDETTGRLGAVAFGAGVDVVEPGYLGTFMFRATEDARGTFYVDLRKGVGTFIRDSRGAPISFERDPGAVIMVETIKRPRVVHPRRE